MEESGELKGLELDGVACCAEGIAGPLLAQGSKLVAWALVLLLLLVSSPSRSKAPEDGDCTMKYTQHTVVNKRCYKYPSLLLFCHKWTKTTHWLP